ncbi:MAG TPA: hypothetical protein VMW10_12685 [Alphaproteobacteria bacterium]|nr:hypothetical protein [Alphaproteobacteria bacterium]
MRFLSLFMLLVATAGSLSGCYSFQGAGEDVGITGQMVEGSWVPACDLLPLPACCERSPNCCDSSPCCG